MNSEIIKEVGPTFTTAIPITLAPPFRLPWWRRSQHATMVLKRRRPHRATSPALNNLWILARFNNFCNEYIV